MQVCLLSHENGKEFKEQQISPQTTTGTLNLIYTKLIIITFYFNFIYSSTYEDFFQCNASSCPAFPLHSSQNARPACSHTILLEPWMRCLSPCRGWHISNTESSYLSVSENNGSTHRHSLIQLSHYK